MDRAEWLKERKSGIGGSDAAAILGLNRYSTPYVVWADKTDRLPEKEDTEAMKQGRDLEDYVAKRFVEQTNKKVRRNNRILRNPDYPFAHANIDRDVVGERAGLECKTTSVLNLKRFKNGDFPEEYYVQCVHYMAVTNCDKWYLAVLILNQGFMIYEIDRDEDEISALMAAEKDFWEKYVLNDVPPPMDGKRATTEALNKVFDISNDDPVDVSHLNTEVESLLALKSQIKALESQAELIEQKIKLEIGENSLGNCGKFIITWKEQMRRTLDKGLLVKAYPEMVLTQYEKASKFRTFRIKEAK